MKGDYMNKALLVIMFMFFYLIDLAGVLGTNFSFFRGQAAQGYIGTSSKVVQSKVVQYDKQDTSEEVSTASVLDCVPDGDTVTLTCSNGSSKRYSCGESKGCCLSSEDNGAGCVSNLSCKRISWRNCQ